MITISVINESTGIAASTIQEMLPAFTTQWNEHLALAWGLDQVQFKLVPKGSAPASGSWWLVWLDDSDQADALAYHDLTDEGLPISKVFVRTINADKGSLSVAATHELCEMAVDPTINLAAQDAHGTFWAYEVSDPVEDDSFSYLIGSTHVTDFVLPSWFGHKASGAPYDYVGKCTDAFQVLKGGYAQEFGSSGWTQVNGSKVTKAKSLQAPSGSRRDRRARGHARWSRSATAAQRVSLGVDGTASTGGRQSLGGSVTMQAGSQEE